MELTNILKADVLDIIFEGRNKDYGAYELRKTYNKRLTTALLSAGAFCLLLGLGYFFSNKFKAGSGLLLVKDSVVLSVIPEELKPPVEPPPPPKLPDPPKVEMKQFTPPLITKDDKVKEDEKPPEMETLEDVKIGTINQEGDKDLGIVAPPIVDTKGVIEAPQREQAETIFTKVEIESEFPGGRPAWERFLNKNLSYPSDAADNEIQGTVVVQFVVDLQGNVSNVEAISGPEELRAEAIRVIKKSGKWTPAIQNGNPVKSYKRQPLVFRLIAE